MHKHAGPLILARLGLGAGRCISESGERGMLADIAGQVPSLRGRALGLQQAVYALGIAVGAPLGDPEILHPSTKTPNHLPPTPLHASPP